MIHILWPTIRPAVFNDVYAQWTENADQRGNIKVRVAVNTLEHAGKICGEHIEQVMVIGEERRGAPWASFILSRTQIAQKDDLIILASDDFFPMKGWDTALLEEFKTFDGCLIVNDRFQERMCPKEFAERKIYFIPLPIMTWQCLCALGGIIYHPVYHHNWSDNELMDNVTQLGLVKNIMYDKKEIYFEHRHYSNSMRAFDDVDRFSTSHDGLDAGVYKGRKSLPVVERLKI